MQIACKLGNRVWPPASQADPAAQCKPRLYTHPVSSTWPGVNLNTSASLTYPLESRNWTQLTPRLKFCSSDCLMFNSMSLDFSSFKDNNLFKGWSIVIQKEKFKWVHKKLRRNHINLCPAFLFPPTLVCPDLGPNCASWGRKPFFGSQHQCPQASQWELPSTLKGPH